jgi:hypothetical protein
VSEDDALADVLDDLRQLAQDHPRARSVMIRLLRSVRDAITDLLNDDQASEG